MGRAVAERAVAERAAVVRVTATAGSAVQRASSAGPAATWRGYG